MNIYKLSEIGTDPNRAQVLSPEGKKLLLDNFKAAFLLKDKNFIAKRADGTTFKPAELTDDEIINDRTRLDRQGYSAIPLDGIWARARTCTTARSRPSATYSPPAIPRAHGPAHSSAA